MVADVIETGLEPQFFLDTVAKAEPAGSGAVRVYFACHKHGIAVVQFSVVASATDFVRMAKQVLELAGSLNNGAIWLDFMDDMKAH